MKRAGYTAALLCWLAACSSGSQLAPTQMVVRVYANRPVDGNFSSLRVRVASLSGSTWTYTSDRNYPVSTDNHWPLDIVVVPAPHTSQEHTFEIIVDALDVGGASFAQRRELAGFVPQQSGLLELELWVDPCGKLPAGSTVCSDDSCHGDQCLTCIDGACAPVPTAVFQPFHPEGDEPDAAKYYDAVSVRDAGLDARTDAAPVDASDGKVIVEDMDASPTAALTPSDGQVDSGPVCDAVANCGAGATACSMTAGVTSCTCGAGYSGTGSSMCTKVDHCSSGVTTTCGIGASGCIDQASGYVCSCGSGYQLDVNGHCADIDECTQNPCTQVCTNTPGSYECACFAGYTGADCHAIGWGLPFTVVARVTDWDLAVSAGSAHVLYVSSCALMAVFYRNGAWGSPAVIPTTASVCGGAPRAAINASGDAIATWYVPIIDATTGNSTGTSFYGARYSATNLTVTSSGPISTAPIDSRYGNTLLIDPHGAALATYQAHPSGLEEPHATWSASGATWSAEQVLESQNLFTSFFADSAFDAQGNALVIGTYFVSHGPGEAFDLWAWRSSASDHAWTQQVMSQNVSVAGNVPLNQARLAMAPDLTWGLATWCSQTGAATCLLAARPYQSYAWGTANELNLTVDGYQNYAVAAGAGGYALLFVVSSTT